MHDNGEQSMKRRVNDCLALVSVVLLASGAGAVTDGVPIRNDTVWKEDRGREIMCQGGNLCKFGDTFYFYGWADYPGDNRNDTVTCYSSKDLSHWKFERDVATYGKNGFNIVPDRLHVLYNDSTKKYVMITKHRLPYQDPVIPDNPRKAGEIGLAECDTPTGDFVLHSHRAVRKVYHDREKQPRQRVVQHLRDRDLCDRDVTRLADHATVTVSV